MVIVDEVLEEEEEDPTGLMVIVDRCQWRSISPLS